MATYNQTFDSTSNAESHPCESNNLVLIREAIDRMRCWIVRYVQSIFGPSVSATDFTERIERRLMKRSGTQENDPKAWDAAVQNTVKSLVHEDRRLAHRRAQFVSPMEVEEAQDPRSLDFESRLEVESEVRFIREQIPPDLLPIIDSLFGFVDEEEVSLGQLAKRLGIRTNTLSQRLHRLYVRLRASSR